MPVASGLRHQRSFGSCADRERKRAACGIRTALGTRLRPQLGRAPQDRRLRRPPRWLVISRNPFPSCPSPPGALSGRPKYLFPHRAVESSSWPSSLHSRHFSCWPPTTHTSCLWKYSRKMERLFPREHLGIKRAARQSYLLRAAEREVAWPWRAVGEPAPRGSAVHLETRDCMASYLLALKDRREVAK